MTIDPPLRLLDPYRPYRDYSTSKSKNELPPPRRSPLLTAAVEVMPRLPAPGGERVRFGPRADSCIAASAGLIRSIRQPGRVKLLERSDRASWRGKAAGLAPLRILPA